MLSLNTNMTSLLVQKNLKNATKGLNAAIEKLSTGYKLNHAKDNPANYALARSMESKLSAWNIAQDNIMIGNDMLETASSNAELIYNHISRIRNLCEQACNGTYSENSINAIKLEVKARIDEIDRIREGTEFNDIKIFGERYADGHIKETSINIQAGIDSSPSSVIPVNTTLYLDGIETLRSLDVSNPSILDNIDNIIDEISVYQVHIGASQNRLECALDYADITTRNLTSSLSTIKDADIAEVSSEFIKCQILLQACATLLATANQMPAMALQLL